MTAPPGGPDAPISSETKDPKPGLSRAGAFVRGLRYDRAISLALRPRSARLEFGREAGDRPAPGA